MIWSFLSQKTNTANVQKVKEGKSHTIDFKRTLDWIRNKGYTITREQDQEDSANVKVGI